jgi:hypothetical protein
MVFDKKLTFVLRIQYLLSKQVMNDGNEGTESAESHEPHQLGCQRRESSEVVPVTGVFKAGLWQHGLWLGTCIVPSDSRAQDECHL